MTETDDRIDENRMLLGLGEPRGPDFVNPRGPEPELLWPTYRPVAPPAPAAEPSPRPSAPNRVLLVAVVAALLAGGAAGAAGGWAAAGERAPAPLPQSSAGPVNGAGDLSEMAARVQLSVVSVEVRNGTARGTGSGFVLDRSGHVLTNAHVVDGGGEVTVVLADRRRLDARVVGADERQDIAVLAISASDSPPPLTMGRSSDVRVGDPVLAIGSPMGLAGTVTGGIVSALDRQVRLGNAAPSTVVQTDASINPGNSGGPLVNARGEVVGGSGSIGIGFAIPVDRAVDTAQRLIR